MLMSGWRFSGAATSTRRRLERGLNNPAKKSSSAVEVLRLLTTRMVMGNGVKTMLEAWALLDKICADDRIAPLAEPEAIEPAFRQSPGSAIPLRRYGQMRTSLRLPRSPVLSSSRLIVDFARWEPTCTFYKILSGNCALKTPFIRRFSIRM